MTHSSCVLELEYGLSNLALKAQAQDYTLIV